MWYVYILQCSDKTFYTGVSNDLERRVWEHNFSDKAAKYTRVRRPVVLVYSRKCKNRSAAQKEEWRIKKLSRGEKGELIKNYELQISNQKKLAVIARRERSERRGNPELLANNPGLPRRLRSSQWLCIDLLGTE